MQQTTQPVTLTTLCHLAAPGLANDGGETQCDITLQHIVFFCLKSVSKLTFVLSNVNVKTHSDIYLKSNLAQVLGGYQVLMEFCVTSLMKEPMQGLRG